MFRWLAGIAQQRGRNVADLVLGKIPADLLGVKSERFKIDSEAHIFYRDTAVTAVSLVGAPMSGVNKISSFQASITACVNGRAIESRRPGKIYSASPSTHIFPTSPKACRGQ